MEEQASSALNFQPVRVSPGLKRFFFGSTKRTQVSLLTLLIVLPCLCVFTIVGFAASIDSPAEEKDQDVAKRSSNDEPSGKVAGEETAEVVKETIPEYRVIEVVDGDTIKISYNGVPESVRLIGIDSPEVSDPREPVGCYGKEASEEMKVLLSGKSVYIKVDSSQSERDKYDRLLLYVWRADDDLFVNDEMVRKGFALEYTYDLPYEYQSQFKEAQAYAENNSLGLWGTACACEQGAEKGRDCSGCHTAVATYTNWNCSTYTETLTDNSCSSGCKTTKPVTKPKPSYTCDCSKTCPNMSSCEEAQYQLNVCGCSARDGDNDGIACDTDCQ